MKNGKFPATSDNVIETATVKKIRRVLDSTARHSQMSFIFGPTGRGKTFTARDWMERYGNGVYIRIQTGTTPARLRKQISFALFGHEAGSFGAIVGHIGRRTGFVLIVDEAAHLITETSTATSAKNLDMFRDIYDEVEEAGGHCGICFIFTSCNINKLTNGRMADFLEQFVGRMDNHLNIESKVSRAYEIKPILAAKGADYESAPLIETALEIANGKGRIRSLFKYLGKAVEWRKRTGEAIDAGMLKALREQYESGNYPDE